MNEFASGMPPTRILVVDDHPNTAALLGRAIAQLGDSVEVYVATSGGEALDIFQEKPADILITDVSMPDVNGLELVERLSIHSAGPPKYTALVTAYETPGLLVTAKRLMVNEVITKPVRPERIRQIVQKFLADQGQTLNSQESAPLKVKNHILVADDQPDNILLLSRLLQGEGYEYLTAADGVETLQKAREYHPDLILLDVIMPGKDGFTVLREVRADPAIQHIPIILLTAARVDPSDIQTGLNLGADDYITKPFDHGELMARIRAKLRVKQSEDMLRRRNRELNILPEIGKDLSARLDLEELCAILLRRTVETLGALLGHIVIYTQNGPYQKTYHLPGTQVSEEFPLPQSILALVEQTHQGLIINDTRADGRWQGMPAEQIRSAVAAPLFGRRGLLGLLILTHEHENYFPPEHMTLLQAIVSQAAIAVENASLYASVSFEQKRLSALLQSTADAILMFDLNNTLCMINPAGEGLFKEHESCIDLPLSRGAGYDSLLYLIEMSHARGSSQKGEVAWPDGRVFAALVAPIDNGGNVATLHDITELKRITDELQQLNAELEDRVHARTSDLVAEIEQRQKIEAALRESEERYMLAVNGANDGVWDWNLKNDTIYYSSRWKSMLGYEEGEIGSRPGEWLQRVHPHDIEKVQNALHKHIHGTDIHFEVEYRISDKQNNDHWMLCRGLAIRDKDGHAIRMAGSQTDITARKTAEERLAHNALHDALTGLPNRSLFLYRLDQRLEYSKRHKESLFAVLFIDMDRFKVINDSLGHAVGDDFLLKTAQRLQECIRAEDTISRFGGDEFIILLNEMKDASDVLHLVTRIQEELRSSTLVGKFQRSSTASIGITIYDGNYSNSQEILRDADAAMYRAKAQGGGHYQIFDANMHKNALSLLKLETELKRALENNQWQVYYQPIISLATGEVSGVEALLRWNHPKRGILSPAEFIHIAEESNLIVPIGDYVLRKACEQVRIWRGTIATNLWVSVNLSARQFEDDHLPNKVKQILEETGLPGESLHLEITETIAMKDFRGNVTTLEQLGGLGVSLSLDDFGTGYSSLSSLKKLPLKIIKIDRSFIQDIDLDREYETITAAIISMGRSLKLKVILEGVETRAQLHFAQTHSCDEVQGYLFSKALPASELTPILGKPFLAVSTPALPLQ